jgi:flagellar biosynthesis protein
VRGKGRGAIAERILALAAEHHIPIKSDPALVQILSKLDLDEQIPVELYKAVAELLAFIYSANQRYPGSPSPLKAAIFSGWGHPLPPSGGPSQDNPLKNAKKVLAQALQYIGKNR